MGALIDTSILIAAGRGRLDLDLVLSQSADIELAISAVTASKLLHARLWASLAGKGVSIGAHDLMIAATALANGLALVTRDKRSFPRIPGLKVLLW